MPKIAVPMARRQTVSVVYRIYYYGPSVGILYAVPLKMSKGTWDLTVSSFLCEMTVMEPGVMMAASGINLESLISVRRFTWC